ncbi:MAG: iron chelate uptake ABC transporter family permease subunit, partial [Brevundimonas sp.]
MTGDSSGRLALILAGLIVLATLAAVLFGETAFNAAQLGRAFTDPSSGAAEVLWAVRAPRAATALMVGAALGLSG